MAQSKRLRDKYSSVIQYYRLLNMSHWEIFEGRFHDSAIIYFRECSASVTLTLQVGTRHFDVLNTCAIFNDGDILIGSPSVWTNPVSTEVKPLQAKHLPTTNIAVSPVFTPERLHCMHVQSTLSTNTTLGKAKNGLLVIFFFISQMDKYNLVFIHKWSLPQGGLYFLNQTYQCLQFKVVSQTKNKQIVLMQFKFN